jgi:hypothetical protein
MNEELLQEWKEWFKSKFNRYPNARIGGESLIERLLRMRKPNWLQPSIYAPILTFEEWFHWINTRRVLFEKTKHY